MNHISTFLVDVKIGSIIYFVRENEIKEVCVEKILYHPPEHRGFYFDPKNHEIYFDKDIDFGSKHCEIYFDKDIDFDHYEWYYVLTDKKIAIKVSNLLNNNTGRTEKCPKTGKFIAYKKIIISSKCTAIAVLQIPDDAKRLTSNKIVSIAGCICTYKCRSDKAKVLRIESIDGDFLFYKGTSIFYTNNVCDYITGEMVYPDSFDPNPDIPCSHGIHFFMNREDAVLY